VSGNSSDGCASGCGGCLLTGMALLIGSALLLSGPAGWVLGLVIVGVLLALGADRSKRKTAVLLQKCRPSVASGALASSRIAPLLSPEAEAATITSAVLGTDLDRELDQLLAEARRALDELV